MNRRDAGYGAAVVLVTAAAVLLAVLGWGDGGKDPSPAAEDRTASAPADGERPPESPDPDGIPPGPKEPESELKPVTGSFTEREKEYLSGRVPEGNDPAAVLQIGQESCDRIAYLARHDRDMAVSSLILGEITGARDAVTQLCPKQKPLLADAGRGFADGNLRVAAEPEPGKAVAPGSYRAPGPGEDCSWQVFGAGGKELDSGSWSKGAEPRITVPRKAREVSSTGCHAWLNEGDNG
ncbi:hypothetical protein [Streptomyces lycii]|uniref:DUF732 domain-containing protein n=1 Tax=Streptomyces lycii TaxID=2654337 RepID=A0ABQ7FLV6_9ACTN|nr:hypothetical protein [Streptomyces lycii]KAF4409349.1 hypothetical protein GCU69_09440 [Streptomyces lycii]